MNGKRQTIWLVSMLSLMVVLSAYYLFTEDSGSSSPKDTAGTIQVDTVKDSGSALPSAADSGATASEVTPQGADSATAADPNAVSDSAAAADPNAAASSAEGDSSSALAGTDDGKSAADQAAEGAKDQASASAPASSAPAPSAPTASAPGPSAPAVSAKPGAASLDSGKDAASADSGVSKDDAAVLNEVASQSTSASSLFTNYQYEREQKNLKEQQDLMAAINDMDKSPSDSAAAQEQLHQLEEKESKINGIEEKLQQQYSEAIVKEESNDSYKVVVLSNKLDVKQAASIIDLVMKELSVSQDKVSVQHVSEN